MRSDELRRAKRFPCTVSVIASSGGGNVTGTILNLSGTGALVNSTLRPPMGKLVQITAVASGTQHALGGRIVRLVADGFAVEFVAHPETRKAVQQLLVEIAGT